MKQTIIPSFRQRIGSDVLSLFFRHRQPFMTENSYSPYLLQISSLQLCIHLYTNENGE
jgi:hypothetical protein